jgi:hypothetical protein
MKTQALLLGLLATAMVAAQEAPSALQVEEPSSPAVRDTRDRVASSSGQFHISGGDSSHRSTAAILAEEAKSELLKLTGAPPRESEREENWKLPIEIICRGKPGDPLPARTLATQILVNEMGYSLQIDLHLARGVEPERFKYAITAALIYERVLRNRPTSEMDTPLIAPPWLVEGLREATGWRLNQSDRRLYEALFKSGGMFKIDHLFALDPASFEELDGATRAAFRVSAGALVMALIEQPQGKDGFRAFLTEVAAFQGETPGLLRKHFPELNLSETSLAKWWALQLANIGGQNLATDVMTAPRTEAALVDCLRLNLRTAEGIFLQKDLAAWPEIAALPEPDRIKSVQLAEAALVRLSYRCFPSYRPILSEYQQILRTLVQNKTQDTALKLADLETRRETMRAKIKRASDYLDWFEITRARETSGVFDDYMRLKERLKSNPHRRTDDLSKYLDRAEAIFHRKGNSVAPVSPIEPAVTPEFEIIPELPSLDLPE